MDGAKNEVFFTSVKAGHLIASLGQSEPPMDEP
jgi:hypothetical protein